MEGVKKSGLEFFTANSVRRQSPPPYCRSVRIKVPGRGGVGCVQPLQLGSRPREEGADRARRNTGTPTDGITKTNLSNFN